MRERLALAGAVALLACQPADLSGSVQAYVYRLEPSTRTYALERSTVDNLESLRSLRGRDIDVRAGSELNLSLGGDDVRRGSSFQLEWTTEADGTIRPADLHSLYALSMYRNLDRVASLLRAHGHTPSAPLDVFYFPRMDNLLLGDTRAGFTDNAAFAPGPNVFLIVPTFVLADVPMFLNEGVMAHEFGHAVIHQETFAEVGEASLLDPHAAAMHEGVADLIGFIATGDPDYIGPTADIQRDLSIPADYTDADYQALFASVEELIPTWDPHYDGSVMARAIYEAWPKGEDGKITGAERSRMLDRLLATLRSIEYSTETFRLGTFPNALVAQLDAPERATACAVFRTRLAPLVPELTNCEAP